ncbi:MAG: hypothetical protein LKI53_06680 [Bacteroidales bacterium]|jgi:hypothetical protein|nr:hypothetical protein [Bacteroidales bacterium]
MGTTIKDRQAVLNRKMLHEYLSGNPLETISKRYGIKSRRIEAIFKSMPGNSAAGGETQGRKLENRGIRNNGTHHAEKIRHRGKKNLGPNSRRNKI